MHTLAHSQMRYEYVRIAAKCMMCGRTIALRRVFIALKINETICHPVFPSGRRPMEADTRPDIFGGGALTPHQKSAEIFLVAAMSARMSYPNLSRSNVTICGDKINTTKQR